MSRILRLPRPNLPSFADLDHVGEAIEAAATILDQDPVDMDSARGRAGAFQGALSALDLIEVTGREFWAVYDKEPARSVYKAWARNALAKPQEIAIEAEKQDLGQQ